MVGLVLYIFRLMSVEELRELFEEAGVIKEEVVNVLVNIFKRYE